MRKVTWEEFELLRKKVDVLRLRTAKPGEVIMFEGPSPGFEYSVKGPETENHETLEVKVLRLEKEIVQLTEQLKVQINNAERFRAEVVKLQGRVEKVRAALDERL